MRNVSKEHFTATNVLIQFGDSSVSFHIRDGESFADISETLDKISKWHRGQPLSIDVRFKAPNSGGRGRALVCPLISLPISQRRRAPYDLRAQRNLSPAADRHRSAR
jgi:hypothetical protein